MFEKRNWQIVFCRLCQFCKKPACKISQVLVLIFFFSFFLSPLKRIFTCKMWLRYSREGAPQSFAKVRIVVKNRRTLFEVCSSKLKAQRTLVHVQCVQRRVHLIRNQPHGCALGIELTRGSSLLASLLGSSLLARGWTHKVHLAGRFLLE